MMSLIKALKRNLVYIVLLSVFIILLLIDTGAYSVRINYGDVSRNAAMIPDARVCLDTYRGEVFLSSEHVINNPTSTGMIRTSHWTQPNRDMKFIFEGNRENDIGIQINSMVFRFLFFPIYRIDSGNYIQAFTTENSMTVAKNGSLDIRYTEQRAVVSCCSDYLIQAGILTRIRGIKFGLVAFMLAVMALFVFLDLKVTESRKADYIKWLVVLGIIVCLVFGMSILGTANSNPDEKVSSESVKYYYSHWGLPDYNSEEASGTISNYGQSRLKEITPYYFFAGKIGLIIGSIANGVKAYRIMNLVLLFVLCVIYFKYGKKNKWLLIGLIISPQLWYIFSYTTSDAWDYFISYGIIILMLMNNRIVRRTMYAVVRGVAFGVLFLGKQNYYIIAIFALFIYSLELLLSDREQKKQLIKEYTIILLIAAVIYAARIGIDLLYYGGNKGKILSEVGSSYKQVTVVPLRTLGKDLSYVVLETNLFERLFKSFSGIYGWMKYESGSIYYWIIDGLYVALLIYIIVYFVRKKDHYKTQIMIISYSMIVLSCILVVYHCWTSDFQSQGRYIFPFIPCIMYLVAKDKKLQETRAVEYLLEGIALFSIYSFVQYGMSSIIG